MTPLKVKQAISYQTNSLPIIQTSSYVGSGYAGTDHKMKISYARLPKLIIIVEDAAFNKNDSNYVALINNTCIFIYGQTQTHVTTADGRYFHTTNLKVEWYSSYMTFYGVESTSTTSRSEVSAQLNITNVTYKVIMIG